MNTMYSPTFTVDEPFPIANNINNLLCLEPLCHISSTLSLLLHQTPRSNKNVQTQLLLAHCVRAHQTRLREPIHDVWQRPRKPVSTTVSSRCRSRFGLFRSLQRLHGDLGKETRSLENSAASRLGVAAEKASRLGTSKLGRYKVISGQYVGRLSGQAGNEVRGTTICWTRS